MLSTVLAATATVLGASVLALLLLQRGSSGRPSPRRRKREEDERPFREVVENVLVRLANVESQQAVHATKLEGIAREADNARARAAYHAQRAQESAAELKELLGLAQEEDDELRADDEAGGGPEGVLSLPDRMERRDSDAQREGEIAGPSAWDIARMNSGG